MKTKHILYILCSLLFLFSSCSEDLIDYDAHATLKGTTRVKDTNQPLANVKITTTPSTQTVYSDANGNFEIKNSIPYGDFSVKAELDGYITEVEAINIQDMNQVVSVAFEFVKDDRLNTPPTVPELITPEDLAVDVMNDVELKWSSSDVDKDDTLRYRVLLKNNTTNAQKEFPKTTDTVLALEDLHFGTTYTWQVIVSDGVNPDVYSKSSQFTIRDNPEYRYHYVQKINGNYAIKATNLEETITITDSIYSSWRPHKNNTAQKIAFLRSIGGDPYLMTSDFNGENVQQISQVPVNGFRIDMMDYDWKTDGSQFLFPNFDKLYIVNHDGTGQHQIYQTPDGSFITKCAWNEDSSKIAIVTNNLNGYDAKIIILDGSGSYLQTILQGNPGAVGGLDWNITGDKLMYTYDVSGHEDANYRQLNTHIFIYNFSTSVATDVSDLTDKDAGTIDIDPRFSPDNGSIIFTNTSNDMISQRNIYSIDLDDLGSSSGADSRTLVIENAAMGDYE